MNRQQTSRGPQVFTYVGWMKQFLLSVRKHTNNNVGVVIKGNVYKANVGFEKHPNPLVSKKNLTPRANPCHSFDFWNRPTHSLIRYH